MSATEDFQQQVLRGHDLPADLRLLVAGAAEGEETPFDDLEAEPLLPGSDDVNDTSYLSEEERADPDIAANLAAIDEVLARAVWVARDGEGRAYGYWLEGRAEADGVQGAPIVTFDSEGQFDLSPAATLAEACVYANALDEEDFEAGRDAFAGAGIAFSAQTLGELDDVEATVSPTPAELHVRRYEELLKTS